MRRLPPLNALRVFDAAARCLNFSAAAEELCVTHSAVSHQIRQLENWLGKSLFVRHAAGVRLTAAGHSLQHTSDQALSSLEARCAAIMEQVPVTEIVLGAPGSVLANWLIPRLERFETAHPEIRIRLQTSTALKELQTQSVDALIVSGRSWPRQVEAVCLFEEQTGPVCAPHGPHRFGTPGELLGLPLLHTSSHPQAWSEWALAQGLDPAGFGGGRQFDHLTLMLEAAAAGLGVAIAPALLVQRDLANRRLVAPLGFVPCGAAFAFCTMSHRRDDALRVLRDWLKAEGSGSATVAPLRPVMHAADEGNARI